MSVTTHIVFGKKLRAPFSKSIQISNEELYDGEDEILVTCGKLLGEQTARNIAQLIYPDRCIIDVRVYEI